MAIVARGICEEVFTPVEPCIGAEAVIGLANGLVDWFSPVLPRPAVWAAPA